MNMICTGSSVRASSSGDCSLTKRAIRLIEATVPADRSSRWIRTPPALPAGRSKMRAALARCPGARPSAARAACARQQPPHQRLAASLIVTLHDRAVAEDQGQRRRQPLENRPGELVAPPGRNRHLDAGVDGACNGREVCFGNLAVAVEDGTVEVKGDQTDHLSGSGFRGSEGSGFKGSRAQKLT